MHRLKLAALVAVVALAAVASAWVQIGRAEAPSYGRWAPGVHAEVGAMNRVAPDRGAPAELLEQVRHIAKVTGGDSDDAVASLRKLQSGLGVSKATLYAFSPGQGAVCLVLWKWSATCPTAEQSRTPGVVSVMSGGYPTEIHGKPATVPTSFAGLVADNVKTITFVNNGESARVPIRNNTFFHVPAEPAAGTPWSMELRVGYDDGSIATLSLPDPRA